MTRRVGVKAKSRMDAFLDSLHNARWMEYAACAGADPGAWFPEAAHGEATKAAIRICKTSCPVRAHCLEYALTTDLRVTGIWGGLTEQQRRNRKRKRASQ